MELAPAATTGPGAVDSEPLTRAQWDVFMSIMDTVISCRSDEPLNPSTVRRSETEYNKIVHDIRYETTLDTATVDAFLAEKPSEMPLFQDMVKRVLAGFPHDKLSTLGNVLSLMNNWATSFPVTGYLCSFPKLALENRIVVLHSWRNSSLASFRVLFKQLTTIAKHTYVRTSSLFSLVSGFPSAPSGWYSTESFPFDFKQLGPSREPVYLETDAIVVGSGCGAGVVARNIATAGHRVMVVDKSYHLPTFLLPLDHSEAFSHLFEQSGLLVSEDGSITVTSGSCFGGGGTVNYSASLQTQNTVREEWADKRGLTFFKSSEFQTCLDNVCKQMGVSDEYIRHNQGNSVLLEGGRKLGFTAKAVPQNTAGSEHYYGHCSLGCWRGEKQGPVNGWFPDAAKCGAEFREGFKVDRVLLSKRSGRQIAYGVTGTWIPRGCGDELAKAVTIKAKRVIISAGSLCSPIILKNSGLKANNTTPVPFWSDCRRAQNKHIGRNLHLHPITFVGGVFKEETRPWEGGILTSVVTSLDNLDGKGHGVRQAFYPYAYGLS
ncbi:hypothetical protein BFJ63_vAg17952 [Fusarium oxysporum f. sp. narcissi]|uniref:Glucose-methanol-choline oxidoreductase N-terminal domain-containing protein n=1 Tax=Fusarium oxysporum f. sp. narcissi TaxID=451672 RepID=A0A4Q2UXM2_FUSOX|nr:hypothetical protein BFJ63_vAg17952 [Fusarium oxysporum f. sp. narcissi]